MVLNLYMRARQLRQRMNWKLIVLNLNLHLLLQVQGYAQH